MICRPMLEKSVLNIEKKLLSFTAINYVITMIKIVIKGFIFLLIYLSPTSKNIIRNNQTVQGHQRMQAS